MPRAFIIVLLSFAFALSALGSSVEFSVTRETLDQGNYVFSVSTNAVPEGTSFHVTITAKTGTILPDSSVGLSIAAHWTNGASISPVTNTPPVTVKKEERVWTIDFVASPELLKTPDVCLVFEVLSHHTINGKSVPMPAVDFYEIKLQDFVKR